MVVVLVFANWSESSQGTFDLLKIATKNFPKIIFSWNLFFQTIWKHAEKHNYPFLKKRIITIDFYYLAFGNMIELKQCFFQGNGKNDFQHFGPNMRQIAEIPMSDNGFCGSLSDAKKIENLNFFAFFESFHSQFHLTPEWAKSDRNSLI